jgi:hypothetical protein
VEHAQAGLVRGLGRCRRKDGQHADGGGKGNYNELLHLRFLLQKYLTSRYELLV